MTLNQLLYVNGEVVKLWLYPRGPDSGYIVYPGSGNRHGYFDTTPLAHPLANRPTLSSPWPRANRKSPTDCRHSRSTIKTMTKAQRRLGRDSSSPSPPRRTDNIWQGQRCARISGQ